MRHSCPPSLAHGAKSHATRNSRAAARSGSSCSPLRSGAAGTTSASSSFASCSGFASSAPHPRCARPRHRAGPAVGGASCPSPCNALSPALRSGCGPCRRCRAPMTHSRWATCLTSRVRAGPVGCRFADAPSVGRELPNGGPLLPRGRKKVRKKKATKHIARGDVAMPRMTPSALSNAVRRAIASALHTSAGTRACARSVGTSMYQPRNFEARVSNVLRACPRGLKDVWIDRGPGLRTTSDDGARGRSLPHFRAGLVPLSLGDFVGR